MPHWYMQSSWLNDWQEGNKMTQMHFCIWFMVLVIDRTLVWWFFYILGFRFYTFLQKTLNHSEEYQREQYRHICRKVESKAMFLLDRFVYIIITIQLQYRPAAKNEK